MLVPSATFSTSFSLTAAGAGAIISAGLMRMLSFEEVEDFITNRARYPPAGQVVHKQFALLHDATLTHSTAKHNAHH